jgi:hypothetical protein
MSTHQGIYELNLHFICGYRCQTLFKKNATSLISADFKRKLKTDASYGVTRTKKALIGMA